MIRGIEHIGITVSDLQQAEHFFIGALEAFVLYRIVPPADAENRENDSSKWLPCGAQAYRALHAAAEKWVQC